MFKKIDCEEKAYWLGFLYADGYVSSNRNTIELCLAEKDYGHLVKFKKFIGKENGINKKQVKQYTAYRYGFRDSIIKKDLFYLGCIPNKSLILKFPNYEQVPKNLMHHFMRGYFDGDGYFTNTEKTLSLGFIGTEDFLNGAIEEFDLKRNKLYEIHKGGNNLRYIMGGKKDIENFLNLMYKDATIYLDRKYDNYLFFARGNRNITEESEKKTGSLE